MATLQGADPTFASKVNALIAASGGRVRLVSGVRTTQRQTALWERALEKYGSEAAARKWVAKPGSSNHEKGRAVDLGGDLALAARLAPTFGLHRPLPNEPWHFEPVGIRGKAAAAVAPAPEAQVAPAAPVEADTRRSLDTQLTSFLNILESPVDFMGQVA